MTIIGLTLLSAPSVFAQSDTLPSATGTSGVTIIGNGRSIKPAELTPTGPRTPVPPVPPPPTVRDFRPLVPQPR